MIPVKQKDSRYMAQILWSMYYWKKSIGIWNARDMFWYAPVNLPTLLWRRYVSKSKSYAWFLPPKSQNLLQIAISSSPTIPFIPVIPSTSRGNCYNVRASLILAEERIRVCDYSGGQDITERERERERERGAIVGWDLALCPHMLPSPRSCMCVCVEILVPSLVI